MTILNALRIRAAFDKADMKLAKWSVTADAASCNSGSFFSCADSWFGPGVEDRPHSLIRDLALQEELLGCSSNDEVIEAYKKHEYADMEASIQRAIREYQESDDSSLAREYRDAGKSLAEIDDGKYDKMLQDRSITKDFLERERAYYQSLLSCSTDDDVIAAYRAYRKAGMDSYLHHTITEFEERPNTSWLAREYRDAGKELQELEENRKSIIEMIGHIKSGDAFIYKNCLVDPKKFGFCEYGEKRLVFETKDDVDKLYATQDAMERLEQRVSDISNDLDLYQYLIDHKRVLLDAFSARPPDDYDIKRIQIFEEFILPRFD